MTQKRHVIAQGLLYFYGAKDLGEIPMESPLVWAPIRGGVG